MRIRTGNGDGRLPLEVLDGHFVNVIDLPPPRVSAPRSPFWPALILFLLTVAMTLAAGAMFAISYANDSARAIAEEGFFALPSLLIRHPHELLLGIPFAATLLGFLMAHEMGHFLACKYYGVDCSYPFFLPSPFFFGTFGALIRIRSPITTRRALFDIGIAGPILGFIVAVPLLAYGIAISRIVPGEQDASGIIFGVPPIMRFFVALFHPGADPYSLLLHPIARAAWFGLLATALNLLPVWQLDGGHIIYSLTPERHQRISLAVALGLVFLGVRTWYGWTFWGLVLLVLSLRLRHPPLYDRWQPLDASRKLLAVLALVMFLFCLSIMPVNNPW
ncbi:MAG: site-2 protease family protein [Candidatus Acidiferrales bacterium]